MQVRFFWLLVAILIFASTPALALSGAVLLGFGDSYVSTAEKTSTHRGVDVTMASGSQVKCPASGQVRFAGRVPGTGGGTVLAVTVATDGGSVTMLPLDTLSVKAGDAVGAGDPVGTLAAAGDVSSDEPHLHLGLKHGDLYVDPSGLLEAVPAAGAEGGGAEQPVPATQDEAVPVDEAGKVGGAAIPIGAPAPVATAPTAAGAPRAPRTTVAEPVPTVPRTVTGTAATSRIVAPGVSLEPAERSAGAGVTQSWVGRRAPSVASLQAPIRSGANAVRRFATTPETLVASTATAVGAGAILLVVLVFTTRRAVARRVAMQPRMSDRFGIFVAAPVNR